MKNGESELFELTEEQRDEVKILLEELSMQIDQGTGFPSKLAERAAKALREMFGFTPNAPR